MNTKFTYRTLHYIHSQFLDEKLNIGILFHFKDTNKIIFKYPKAFKRIKDIYNDFVEWQLKSYLKAIEEKVNRINNENNSLFSEIKTEEIISEEILKKDATALAFSELKTAEIYSLDTDKIVEDYYNLYFSNYKIGFKKEKHDEEYLLRKFKSQLFDQNASIQNLLRKDVQIKGQKISVKFEYLWKNGVENLVKPVSFDLEEESSINNKAVLLHGQLNFIADEIKNNNYNVDLLIAPPAADNPNPGLLKAYKNALDILGEIKIKKSIVQESEVSKYVQKVASEIHL